MTRQAAGLVCCLLLGGCVWHGPEARHFIGPVWVRQSHGRAEVTQTMQGPVVMEAGKQWGLAVGVVRQLAANPVRSSNGVGAVASPDAGQWQFSPFYKRIGSGKPVEFSASTIIGARVAAGTEVNALSLAYMRRTEFRPQPDGFYLLSYTSRQPELMDFLFDPEQLPGLSVTNKYKVKP